MEINKIKKTGRAKKVIAGLGLAAATLLATVAVSTTASPVSPATSAVHVTCDASLFAICQDYDNSYCDPFFEVCQDEQVRSCNRTGEKLQCRTITYNWYGEIVDIGDWYNA